MEYCTACKREFHPDDGAFIEDGVCIDCRRAYIDAPCITVVGNTIFVLRRAGLDLVVHQREVPPERLALEVAVKVQRGVRLVSLEELQFIARLRGIICHVLPQASGL